MLNKEFFTLFVLAHLIGDYVLQTNHIAKIKAEGFKGVAIHTLLVGLAQLCLLSFFGIGGIVAALVGAGIHFLIDCLKIILSKSFKKRELLLYLADQLLHLLVIMLLTFVFAPAESGGESYLPYARLFIAFIVLFYTSTVTAKTVVRNFFPEMVNCSFFEKNERWSDALVGGLLYASFVIHPVLAIFASVIGAFVYCRIQKSVYRYRLQVSLAKYATLVLFVLLAAFFL